MSQKTSKSTSVASPKYNFILTISTALMTLRHPSCSRFCSTPLDLPPGNNSISIELPSHFVFKLKDNESSSHCDDFIFFS